MQLIQSRSMKTITGIHGVPRSGTSWLAQIFNASPGVSLKFQPLFSYAFKDFINLDSSANDIVEFLNNIADSQDAFINMNDPEIHKNYPVFNKLKERPHLIFKHVRYHYLIEHFLENNPKIKFVLIIRNPLSVLSSWKNAPREFKPEWNFDKEWLKAEQKNQNRPEEYFGYLKWKEAANLFNALALQYPERVTICQYSNLLTSTIEEINRLMHFTGVELDSQIIDFIEESKHKTISGHNSVYRKKSGDDAWKREIDIEIQQYIFNDLKGGPLEVYLN
jgi:Sulfotransferase domain